MLTNVDEERRAKSGLEPVGAQRSRATEETTEIHLTPRERVVLANLSQGACNKSIASKLGCSVRTVEFHVSNLLRKTGVASRLELVGHKRRQRSE